MTENVDPKEPATATSPEEPEVEALPEPALAEASPDAEAGADERAAEDERAGEDEPAGEDDEGQGDEEHGGEEQDAAASGDGEPKKKRRRRRRRKKKGAPGEGAEAASAPEGEAPPAAEPPKKKEPSHLPFQRLFDGAARRHAFSVGEIVAGRVVSVGEDVAAVDLFGKATAYARLHEPREIPVASAEPEPEEETDEDSSLEASEPSAEAEASGAEEPSAEAEALGAEEPSAERPSAEPPSEAASAAAASEQPASEAPREATSAELTEADAAPLAPHARHDEEDPALLEGMPEERELRAQAEVAEHEAEAPAPAAERPPVPEPAYVLRPEGVPPLEAGGICRGRVGAVAESGHIALVNELVDIKSTRAYLRRAKDDRARVPGLVFGFNRGGFDVLVYGMRAFCPVSGLTLEMIDDPEPLLGQWAQFHVQAAKSGVQGLVVSRRSILEKEARKRARQLLKSLEPGQTVRGRVTQVREFGVFVDIGGGLEGLVHQSELSWERGVKPEDVANVGDELEVQILKVHERENKRERYDRVSLSLKALQPDPWKEALGDIAEGAPRKGTIVRTAEFGAFVQLAPGVDGLLHITELGRELKHADQAVSVGDEIHVVVERIDRKQRRISLSRLSPEDAEAFEKGELAMDASAPRVKQGGHVKVKVTQVSPAGLQVQVENVVGRRGRGFIPNAEMGTPRGTDHRRQWPPGTEIDVTIIGTDRDGGLRCSRKRYLADEERRAVREYRKEVSKQGLGTFGDILRQKLGIDQEGTR